MKRTRKTPGSAEPGNLNGVMRLRQHVSLLAALCTLIGSGLTFGGGFELASQYRAVFEKPPQKIPSDCSVDAPLMGNGDTLVALGGVPGLLQFYIGKNDLWIMRPNGGTRPQPLSRLDIEFPAMLGASYRVEQDLARAVTTGWFKKDGRTLTLETAVAATENLLWIKLSAEGGELTGKAALFLPGQNQTQWASLSDNGAPASIGREEHGGGRWYFDGEIADVMVTNAVLSGNPPAGPRKPETFDGKTTWKKLPVPRVDKTVSVAAWIKIADASPAANYIVSKGEWNQAYSLGLSNGRLRWAINGTFVQSEKPLETGKWLYVAGTYDHGSMRAFVNGEDIAAVDPASTKRDGDVQIAERRFEQEVMLPAGAACAVRVVDAGESFTVAPGRPVLIAAAVASRFDTEAFRTAAVKRAATFGMADLETSRTAHEAWWRAFWGKSFVEVPDKVLEQRYYLSHYVLASASRVYDFPPGIFGWVTTDHPMWFGDYHMNYNHVAPFYGLYAANHIEQADPCHGPILANAEQARELCRKTLGVDGIFQYVGIGPRGSVAYKIAMMQKSNSSYSCVPLVLRWYATYDLDFARQVYPFVRDVATFWENWLKYESGRYVIYKDAVHEDSGDDVNPIVSLAFVRMLMNLALDMSRELDVDAERHAQWTHIRDHISAYPECRLGDLQRWWPAHLPRTEDNRNLPIFRYTEKGTEWWSDNTVGIQHIFPAGGIGLDSPPDLLERARNQIMVMNRWEDFNGMNSFYAAAARVGYDPGVILREMRTMIEQIGGPNGMIPSNPHGMEHLSIVPNAIQEMLIQSHEGVIRLFPCWPKDQDARFGTLRARGAFLVSAELKRGEVGGVTIVSEKGRDCMMVNPWPGKPVTLTSERRKESFNGDRFTFKTSAGEKIILTSGKESVAASGGNVAPTENLARQATATGRGAHPEAAIDGIKNEPGRGEWIGGSPNAWYGWIDYPSLQLTWPQPITVNKVILHDRPGLDDHLAGAILKFSDGSEVSATAIPNDGSPKTLVFLPREINSLNLAAVDGVGTNIGLSEIEVFHDPTAKPAVPRRSFTDFVSYVDPTIETGRGRWFFCTPGSLPFGMISASAYTRNKNQGGGGYNYNSTEIRGFTQQKCWIMSSVNLMPVTGDISPNKGEAGWLSKFSRDTEVIEPGYHQVFLDRYRTKVEYTATERVAYYRLTYKQAAKARLLLQLGGFVGSASYVDGRATLVSPTRIEGSHGMTDRLWGGPNLSHVHFVIETDRPITRMDGWNGPDETLPDIRSFAHPVTAERLKQDKRKYLFKNLPEEQAGVALAYDVAANDVVNLRIAISFTNIENARDNLARDGGERDFDKVRAAARATWNQWLGKIAVKGGPERTRVKFYTDLWHVLLGRHKLDDASGDYPSFMRDNQFRVRSVARDASGRPLHHMYNSDALWLTMWNLNILWGLGWPEVMDDFSACWAQYARDGGHLPRGPSAGGYTGIMTGSPGTSLLAATYQKGLMQKTDPIEAWRMMKTSNEQLIQLDAPGVAVQGSFEYWALAQMAEDLGLKDEAAACRDAIDSWKKFYSPAHKLLTAAGVNDPLSGQGWVEANAWQGTFGVSHDIPGLAALMGGNDALADKLNQAFETEAPNHFVFTYGAGRVSYANQPGCSNAHVFNHVGHPWLSQYWTRRVSRQAYGGTDPNTGYGGHDEDQGQMGGVSALMKLGLFSLRGTASKDPVYEITAPEFDEITIHLDPRYYPGKTFTIKTHGNAEANCYIQKAELNGKLLDNCWLYHRDFAKGGTLELWLGPRPNKEWGVHERP